MYSEKVMDHFSNPRNQGALEDYDAVGKVGNPVCGDVMFIYIKVVDERISDISFKTMGCGAAIATSSMITELAKGKTLDEAMAIGRDDVANALDGLPTVKMHCSNLAADGLRKAIVNYRSGTPDGEGEQIVITRFTQALGVDVKTAKAMWDAGIHDMDELTRLSKKEFEAVEGIDDAQRAKILPHLTEHKH